MVTIAIYYNGKFPRIHQVSEDFLVRLEKYLSEHSYLDTIIVLL
jgi:hypothetical protein